VFQKGFLLQLPMWKMAGSTTRTFVQLKETIDHNRKEGIYDVFLLLDYYFKLSIPFSCLAMAVCCPPMALKFARGGGFMGTLLSICLVFVYWNTMLLMRILGSPSGASQTALLAPMPAAWGQNIIFLALGLWVLKKSE
jgi:lipopolysaccharide export system permease protein